MGTLIAGKPAGAAAVLASRRPLGLVALTLAAPLIAVGLSYEDLGDAASLGLLLVAGSVAATLISLPWPERPSVEQQPPALLPHELALRYGARLGLAAATAAAIAYAWGTDHPGWAPASVLFVMRPQDEMQLHRSWGRVVSVFVGALIATWQRDPAALTRVRGVKHRAGVAARAARIRLELPRLDRAQRVVRNAAFCTHFCTRSTWEELGRTAVA